MAPVETRPLPPGALTARVRAGRRGRTLAVDGELDAATAPLIRALAVSMLSLRPGPLEVDLHGVTFIDLRGVRAVEAVMRRAAGVGCPARLTMPADAPVVMVGLLHDAAARQHAEVEVEVAAA
jgi:hypothetical protein